MFSGKTSNTTRLNYQVALDVIAGEYGNGIDRMERLEAAGYDAKAVQSVVNAIIYDGYKLEERFLTVTVDLSEYDGITLKFVQGENKNDN